MSVPLHEAIEEFAKLAEIDLNEFHRLSKKNVFNRLETFLTPKIPEEDPDLAQKAQAATQAEREYFKKRYNVTARLTGSMPLKLGVPGDVDLDFYSRIKSPQKFNQVVARLEKNPNYIGSQYNKPGAAFQVYQRKARGKDDFPVDFAIAYGPDADRLSGQINEKERAAAELPKELREALVAKKLILKNTPFDIKHKRYKAWKRNLDKALGGEAIRLKREPHPDLLADLEKKAVSAEDIAGAARRIGAKVIPDDTLKAFGAFASPTRAQMKKVVRMGTPDWQKGMLPEAMEQSLEKILRESPGEVFVEPGAGRILSPTATGKTLKQLDEIAAVHEGLERSVKPHEIQYSSLHLSPKVPAQELNLINRATPDLSEAAERLRSLREAGGEHGLLRQQLQEQFGERAEEFMQPGRKIPKAMMKRLTGAQRPEISKPQAYKMMGGAQQHLVEEAQRGFPEPRIKSRRVTESVLSPDDPSIPADVRAQLQKSAEVMDLTKPEDFTKFQKFVSRQDIYGHRTPHAEAVLGSGKIISALEALQKGKIKSVETGRGVGARKDISIDNKLTSTQIQGLKDALLVPTTTKVDSDKAADIASEAGMEYNEMMAEFLRRKKGDIKKHLGTVSDPEEFRRSHLSIPKLGPNIFVTKGGLMDEPKYGDVGLLIRSRTAKPSPFANTLTDEHIIEQRKPGDPRSVSVRSSLVIAPQAKVRTLSRKFPGYKFVKEEQIPDELRKVLYKPTRSPKEIATRIIPKLLSGELRLQHR